MLRLFSSIRQSLVAENKTAKYLKYAVGEVLLIMIGIILALQFNNWNEGRKLEQQRQELIVNLTNDFQANLERIEESLADVTTVVQSMESFLLLVGKDDFHPSEEEVASFMKMTFGPTRFRPFLGTYKSASASGLMSLLRDPTVYELLLEFNETNDYFQKTRDVSVEELLLHGTPRLRAKIGSLQRLNPESVSPDTELFPYSSSEFPTLMKQEEVYAHFENRYLLKYSRYSRLLDLKDITEQILTTLDALD